MKRQEKEPIKTIQVRVPASIHKTIKRVALEQDMTVAKLILRALARDKSIPKTVTEK